MRLLSVLAAATLLAGAAVLPASPLLSEARAEQKIGVVDFQEALNQVKQGEAAKAKLEALFSAKKKSIDDMETKLRAMQADYEKQAVILSDAARSQKEQEMYQAQMSYQQLYQQSEQEMQQMYATTMEDLITKMRAIAEQIAKERGYTIVLEVTEGGVVYNTDAIDITSELVKRYDAANPG